MVNLLRPRASRSAIPGIIKAANWTAAHHAQAIYSEGTNRGDSLNRPYLLPFISDCSAGVTDLYKWGGAPDPNQLDYREVGYTGTLVAHGRLIAIRKARVADVIIFGPDTGWHAALVHTLASDPIVWSMGEQGDPRLYPLSVVAQAVAYVNNVTTCPLRCFRYPTQII